MEKEKYYIVSFSGGKDSTAMLFHLLELEQPIDEVIFCDTYKEFPQMYSHIEKVKQLVEDKGIKFTILRNAESFDYLMFEKEPNRRNPEAFAAKYGEGVKGRSWACFNNRWCSGELKKQVIARYISQLKKQYEVFQYIGLAADETKRLEKKGNQDKHHIHPLAEWGWSEADCLNYCYSLGFDWGGLYQHFSRVSCWCCPLQGYADLRALRKYYPEQWQQLKEMDAKTFKSFKMDYSVEDLEKRFTLEEQRLAEGKSIRNREFFTELKRLLGRE